MKELVIFEVTVTDIGDATYDESTGITSYEVTVKLSGDLSEVYSGMTARRNKSNGSGSV